MPKVFLFIDHNCKDIALGALIKKNQEKNWRNGNTLIFTFPREIIKSTEQWANAKCCCYQYYYSLGVDQFSSYLKVATVS